MKINLIDCCGECPIKGGCSMVCDAIKLRDESKCKKGACIPGGCNK